MVINTKLYDVLGIKSTATNTEIKRAYHKKALEYHPDKELDIKKKPEKEQKFREIADAYQTLIDPAKRQQYDLYGNPKEPENIILTPEKTMSALVDVYKALVPERSIVTDLFAGIFIGMATHYIHNTDKSFEDEKKSKPP